MFSSLNNLYASPFIFLMTLGMKNEKIKSPIEKKTLKDINSPQLPEAHTRITSYNVCYTKLLRIMNS